MSADTDNAPRIASIDGPSGRLLTSDQIVAIAGALGLIRDAARKDSRLLTLTIELEFTFGSLLLGVRARTANAGDEWSLDTWQRT